MAEINLIKIDGKPLEKLFEVISKGIGKIYEPTAIKKEADAKAYEIGVIENAKAKAMLSSKDIEQDLFDRIEERVLQREIKKQKNLDKINYYAAEDLSHENSVSDEPLDDDWINRFFSYAEDISSESMQMLWGKILAGEVKKPKSYSLRTLELVRNLTKEEAQIFLNISNFTLSFGKDRLIFKGEKNDILEKYNVRFDNIATLVEIGIIQPGDFISFELKQAAEPVTIGFTNGNIIIVAIKKENTPQTNVPVYLFTKIGVELLKLIQINPNMEYLKDFSKYLKKHNTDSKYGYILEIAGTKVRHTNPLIEFEE